MIELGLITSFGPVVPQCDTKGIKYSLLLNKLLKLNSSRSYKRNDSIFDI